MASLQTVRVTKSEYALTLFTQFGTGEGSAGKREAQCQIAGEICGVKEPLGKAQEMVKGVNNELDAGFQPQAKEMQGVYPAEKYT